MSWPQAVDYNEAIQNPQSCFRDPELRQATPWRNDFGMPVPHSGNLADVYRLDRPGGSSWALKCFTRPVEGLQARYQAVSDHLRTVSRPFFVDFQYLEGGIRIGTSWFPAVKMRWIEGFTLNQFVADHADDSELLTKLSLLWIRLIREMREMTLAHGDLQHGNILLVPGSHQGKLGLRLVDYDGLCVPALASKPSGETGHPNYQHPQRKKAGYGLEMDRFSALAILTGLRATAAGGKSLWRVYDRGENLLFREVDFVEPAESELFKTLWLEFGGDVHTLVGRLVLAVRGGIDAVPRLDDLLDGDALRPLTRDETCRVAETLHLPPPPVARSSTSKSSAAHPALSGKPTPSAARPAASPTPVPATKRETTELAPAPAVAKLEVKIPTPTADQRRAATGQFERANQVIATGNYEYGLQLLLACCTLDRANLIYRQALRRTEKAKYKNNLRGAWHAWLTTWPAKARLKAALRAGDHIKALDLAEKVLLRNPWDTGAQMDLARAAEELGLIDLGVWSLEQARQKSPDDPAVNRALAMLFERRGNFTQAMALWAMVRKARPADAEADQKLKDLAVHETIRRGNYAETAANAVAERAGGHGSGEHPTAPSPSSARHTPIASPRSSDETSPLAVLRRRVSETPTDARLQLQLARHLKQSGDLEAARAALQEGMGPTGNAFELIVELTELEIEPFRRDLAITESKLAKQPDNPELLGLRARLTKEIGTRELELYRRKADRFPNEVGHRVEVGMRLLRLGQIDEAIRELQGTRSDPRSAGRAAYHLGHCFMARNNLRLALRNFEEAVEHLPSDDQETRKEARYHLAVTLAEMSDLARAVEIGNDLAHEDYSYRDIARLLDDWQARLQRVE